MRGEFLGFTLAPRVFNKFLCIMCGWVFGCGVRGKGVFFCGKEKDCL